MARAEEAVKQREQKILKREAARLRANDRLEGKEGDPLNEAYNRRTLRKIQRELAASRQEHVEQLKSKLEAEAQVLVKRLEIDYERLDGMSKTEKPAKPD